jgi:hypothetical protein
MKTFKWLLALVVLVAVPVVFTGCEDDDDDGTVVGGKPEVNVTGVWAGHVREGDPIMLNLRQVGSEVTGHVSRRGETGNLKGGVVGTSFTYTITWPGGSITKGTAGVKDKVSMMGVSLHEYDNFQVDYIGR